MKFITKIIFKEFIRFLRSGIEEYHDSGIPPELFSQIADRLPKLLQLMSSIDLQELELKI